MKIKIKRTIFPAIIFAINLILLFVEALADITFSWELKLLCILIAVFSVFDAWWEHKRDQQSQEITDKMTVETSNVRSIMETFKHAKSFAELNEVEKKHGLDCNTNGNIVYIITSYLQESHIQDQSGKELLKTIHSNITKHNVEYYYIIPHKLKRDFNDFLKLLKNCKKSCANKLCKVYVAFDEKIDILFPSEYFDVNIYVDTIKKDREPVINTAEGYYCFSNKCNNNAYLYYKMDEDKAKEFVLHMKEQKFVEYEF